MNITPLNEIWTKCIYDRAILAKYMLDTQICDIHNENLNTAVLCLQQNGIKYTHTKELRACNKIINSYEYF